MGVAKAIADTEDLMLATHLRGESAAGVLNAFLSYHLKPLRVQAGSAVDSDGLRTCPFSTLIFNQTEVQQSTGQLEVSADSLVSVVDLIPKLDLEALKTAYQRIVTVKALRRTIPSSPSSPNTRLGIIFAMESDVAIEVVGEYLDELNRAHPSYLWPDMVVVPQRGLLGYACQFPGEPIMGDFLLPGKDVKWGAPMYVHLFARPGEFVLNRMCSILFTHAALLTPGIKLAPLETILKGVTQNGMTLAGYQPNLTGTLVAVPDAEYRTGNILANYPLRIEGPKGELLSRVRFIPWQDGGLVRIYGKLPLVGLLVFCGGMAKDAVVIRRADGELSSLLPMKNVDFALMLTKFQRQSNMRVKPEPQPAWIASKAFDEGTATPFMARLFFSVLRIRDQVFDTKDRELRHTFDKAYESSLMSAYNARAASKEIRELINGHFAEVRTGACVARRGSTIHIDKNIDRQLRRQAEDFLNSAARAMKGMQDVMRLLGIEISFLYQKDNAFKRGIENLKHAQPELATYLSLTRGGWSERLTRARNALEHAGWTLARVRYEDENGVLRPIEPTLDGEPVSQFVEKTLERLACFIEELAIHGLQQRLMNGISLTEVPSSERSPELPERFRLALTTGGLPVWKITYHEKMFDQA